MAIPSSTYRVQISPAFDMHQTAELASYLAELGVTHLYASPLLQAAPGSAHGYDVVDHHHIDEARGGGDGLRQLIGTLRAHNLGIVIDIVPNHMGVADPTTNAMWWDVLALGPGSVFTPYFDIDWSRGRLVLPVLPHEPDALSELRIEEGELRFREQRFPLAVGTAESGTPQEIHDRQHYELMSWRRGNSELNYRRFFAVSTLAGLRVEEPHVYGATHEELLKWAVEVDGVRVDHPDGLVDPQGYLSQLSHDLPADTWLVVEKILGPGESLPVWPCHGTTGYDALAEVDSVFADPDATEKLTALDHELTGRNTRWPDLVHACKRDVATGMLRAELTRLAALASDIPAVDEALAEIAACLPVYRTYLPDGDANPLDVALDEARQRRTDLIDAIDALHERLHDGSDELCRRFQQFSGAVMAKGVEDTAYYRWTRFLPSTEVGGDPSRIGCTPADFHAANASRTTTSMTTLSTHDTKRGEDVRARLAVLTEMPDDWATAVRRWATRAPLPDQSLTHLLWQTIVGAWPIERDRLHVALEKAAREARVATTWDDPEAGFETGMHAVIDRVYDDPELHGEVADFVAAITPHGWSNSLGAKLFQLTMPGVPDTYQGTELWDNSLVDPDNRRPVDFPRRRDLLATATGESPPPIDDTGAAKLRVVATALRLRRDLHLTDYRPIEAAGSAAAHAIAFDRGGIVAAATRLPVTLRRHDGWQDTTLSLPDGEWRDALTGAAFGGTVAVESLFAVYPVALLVR